MSPFQTREVMTFPSWPVNREHTWLLSAKQQFPIRAGIPWRGAVGSSGRRLLDCGFLRVSTAAVDLHTLSSFRSLNLLTVSQGIRLRGLRIAGLDIACVSTDSLRYTEKTAVQLFKNNEKQQSALRHCSGTRPIRPRSGTSSFSGQSEINPPRSPFAKGEVEDRGPRYRMRLNGFVTIHGENSSLINQKR